MRLWLLSRDVPTLDSDEATFGLMPLHLGRGEWTTFMWGQAYMGSLESLVSLPFLWFFGVNAFALRLGPLALAVTCTLLLLVDWLFPRRVAMVTPLQTAANDHGPWIYARDTALLTLRQSHHVHTVISNDYWMGLRLPLHTRVQVGIFTVYVPT